MLLRATESHYGIVSVEVTESYLNFAKITVTVGQRFNSREGYRKMETSLKLGK